ncbi:DUF86 domain-containing protein [Bacillus sp. FJAT-42376]|uniref:DUF86 domain-containing protein n=1 Tax=Bacillus sp. FJAT-42376 TaxID=2014076 RepID=UPI000F4FD562|nr:DUF86 domain-containing protein [Bacillus sp. FJAT-42376]AZB44288.1 DUF86 domain-containing protein [Bacillus sp. FJAT-42376]
MYFVDREKIEETLKLMDELLGFFSETNSFETKMEKLALQRLGHLIMECILDTGNALIDGFIMRDPGSYEDIIDILLDEKVIEKEDEAGLKELVFFRKSLIQEYISADTKQLEILMNTHFEVLKAFPPKVRTYLSDELGPVSAFKN